MFGRSEPVHREDAGYFSLLHRDPVVLFVPEWEMVRPTSALWSVLEGLPPRAAYLVVGPSWVVDDDRGRTLGEQMRGISRRFDQVEVVASCATASQAAVLERRGLSALHCSVTALVRDDLFAPSPGRQPRFDAIYDARWTDYKRHDLARAIRSLALIAAPSVDEARRTIRYSLRALAAVKHATWISSPWAWKRRWLSPEQVNAAYNEARVGLCLSRIEGAMFASIQYLLAGLPIVTTRNLGGRDEFFSPAYVRWVDDQPDAVATAVDELVALDVDPDAIRAETLARVATHRARLQSWLQQTILNEGGELGRWSGGWPEGLPHKFREPRMRAVDLLGEIAYEG